MRPSVHFSFLLVLALLAPASAVLAAEKFPTRPIRLIIPSGAGGVTDILGRSVAQKLSESLGQQVVIDNRPGASGIVGSQIVAKSAPDGYTLLMVYPSHVVNPSLFPDIPYDTVKDFAPITMVSAVAPVLVVSAQSPARSVAEFIALAKAKPAQLNHGAVGAGSMGALAADLLASMAGIKFTQVMYKGSPQALTSVVSGEIDFYFIGSVGTVGPQVKAGRIRALGVGAKQRLAPLPDVPPIADTLPGYEARGWNGIFAPAGAPRAVIDFLNRELVKIIRSPELAPTLIAEGAAAIGNSPAEMDAVVRADIAKWAKLIKASAARSK